MTTSLSDNGVGFSDASVQASAAAPQILTIGASVASNALTVTLAPCSLAFRSPTLSSGVVSVVNIPSTLSLTVPAGATLGTINGIQSRLAILAFNVAGTVELAIVNTSGGNDLSEILSGISATISSSSSSASSAYSTTARSGVGYRVVGFLDITQATAGQWATAPAQVQGVGGVALASTYGIGNGQTWQDKTSTRTAGVTYTNTTGKSIELLIGGQYPAPSISQLVITINGLAMQLAIGTNSGGGNNCSGSIIVPPSSTYSVAVNNMITNWYELR